MDVEVDLACSEAFEAADRVAFGVSFRDASFEVGDGGFVSAAESDHDDGPKRGVRAAVSGTVESSSLRVAARDRNGCGATQRSEAGFGGEAFGIVARGAQQRARGFVTDTVMWTRQGAGLFAQAPLRSRSPDRLCHNTRLPRPADRSVKGHPKGQADQRVTPNRTSAPTSSLPIGTPYIGPRSGNGYA